MMSSSAYITSETKSTAITHSAPDISNLRKKAEACDPKAQSELAFLLRLTPYLNMPESIKWRNAAVEQHHPVAIFLLAMDTLHNFMSEGDSEKSQVLFKQILDNLESEAKEGNAYAKYCLGQYYFLGLAGKTKNIQTAKILLQQSAASGIANSEYSLGVICDHEKNGAEFKQDKEQAIHWYEKAAAKGHVYAQFSLAELSESKKEAAHWFQEALTWCKTVSSQTNGKVPSVALHAVGYSYMNGTGVVKNKKEAVEWYQRAAEQGLIEAQLDLGHCYYYSDGIEQNIEIAREWYQKAAAQGSSDAQFMLAKILFYDNDINDPSIYHKMITLYIPAAEDPGALCHQDAKNELQTLLASPPRPLSQILHDDKEAICYLRHHR